MKLSIIFPVFNEEQNILPLHDEVCRVLENSGLDLEFIYVNDGSGDKSSDILRELCVKEKNVKYINLTRNFGHQAALTAGLDFATGDAVITMDCDFQDPPEILPEMISKWKEGYKIVYTRRKERRDRFFKRNTAKAYYKLLFKFSENKIQGNIGDYRLLDKQVLAVLKEMREKSRYLRGMVPWLGYEYTVIDFERPLRKHGETGFSFLTMFRLGMNGILSFSLAPLRLGLIMGVFIIFTGMIFLVYLGLNYFINNQFYKLLEWLAVVNYILIGFLFILFWIIAEYIGKIYNETKERPIYIINDTANIGNIK